MIITSTNDIKNYNITNYIGLINANIVIGANFFSDLFASFTDVLGGYSESYQNTLDNIYNKVLNELKQKAVQCGANALIGVHFDFDEISGKGKSMFMVTAYGTAVKIVPNEVTHEKNDRYEIYQKLYNLFQFKETGIITTEQYETERNNLLLSYNNKIEKELKNIESENKRKEAINQVQILAKQKEEEQKKVSELKEKEKRNIESAIEDFKTNSSIIIPKIREILNSNIKSPQYALETLSYSEIRSANYDDMYIDPSEKMAYTIACLIKNGKIAEACKYYIDFVDDDDVEEAKSYINSIYEIITLKNQLEFEKFAIKLIELKCEGKEEEAINEFAKYSVCDLDVAKIVINML